MGRQFLFASERLLQNQDAFIKTNLLFCPEDYFLLFEPKNEHIYITQFCTYKGKLAVKDRDSIQNKHLLTANKIIGSSDIDHNKGEFQDRFPFTYWHPQYTNKEERAIEDTGFINFVLSNKELILATTPENKPSWMEPIQIYQLAFPRDFLLEQLQKNGQLALTANALTNTPLTFDYY